MYIIKNLTTGKFWQGNGYSKSGWVDKPRPYASLTGAYQSYRKLPNIIRDTVENIFKDTFLINNHPAVKQAEKRYAARGITMRKDGYDMRCYIHDYERRKAFRKHGTKGLVKMIEKEDHVKFIKLNY